MKIRQHIPKAVKATPAEAFVAMTADLPNVEWIGSWKSREGFDGFMLSADRKSLLAGFENGSVWVVGHFDAPITAACTIPMHDGQGALSP